MRGGGNGRPGSARIPLLGAARRRPEFARGPGSATVLNARRDERSAPGSRSRACGRGSVGRASPCQGEGRGFESRRPLGGAGFRPAGPGPHGTSDVQSHASPAGNVGTGGVAEWLRQGPAKPCTRVRFPPPPRGRLAQWESASLTPKRSLVQSQYRPPVCAGQRPVPGDGTGLKIICHQFAIKTRRCFAAGIEQARHSLALSPSAASRKRCAVSCLVQPGVRRRSHRGPGLSLYPVR
ncbi:MAG: hypothetical protein JWL68_1513 [Actinomycetia bacterium]|nr:hypothetical protein [Actinomycetes bacterium]